MVMIVAAMSVVVGLWRTRGTTNWFRGVALLVTRGGMRVNMLMRRAVVVMGMHVGVLVTSNRHPDATRQPKDREKGSE